MSDIPLIGQGNQQPEGEKTAVRYRTAFVVFQDEKTGVWGATNDLDLLADHIEVEYAAHPGLMSQGVKDVAEGILVEKIIGSLDNLIAMRSAQAREAALNAQIAQNLKV